MPTRWITTQYSGTADYGSRDNPIPNLARSWTMPGQPSPYDKFTFHFLRTTSAPEILNQTSSWHFTIATYDTGCYWGKNGHLLAKYISSIQDCILYGAGDGCPFAFRNKNRIINQAGLLYRLRNEVLNTNAGGQHYTDLYYAHSSEIATILGSHDNLAGQGLDVIDALMPNLQALLNGQGNTVVVTNLQVQQSQAFLNALLPYASPELQQAISDERTRRPLENMIGMTMNQSKNYIFDITPPAVISSVRVNTNPANVANVGYTVTFSESVTGVDVSDFSLTTSRISNATVSSVSGSGSSRTVTVNTGSGNGSIRLNLVDNNSIMDASNNPLGGPAVGDGNFTAGQAYTIIKSATFADVPMTYWANTDIERAYNAGITAGCTASPLNYCPENMVTRAQMAVFLLKGVHGSGYTPPAVGSSTGFADVPVTYWAAAWIKQLAVEGITGGCGGGNYCPEGNVTRAQMAVFLLKAKHGTAYVPPAATGLFADVPIGYWARNWIEQLAVEGITAGCGGGNYCPESNVTRAQMAVFLVKTFNLP